MEKMQENFDVAVIGGGPAGMMAAICASELGAKVVLLEGNLILGKKLAMTGGGRCNLTNAQFDALEFTRFLGKKGRFLLFALSIFGPEKVINFFKLRGLEMKIEKNNRVFPITDRASDVVRVLLKELKKNKVEIRTNAKVLNFFSESGRIKGLEIANSQKIYANFFILATGGKSYPMTGSKGMGYVFAQKLGHTITNLLPTLTPVKIGEKWACNLQGLSLKKIKLTIFQFEKKQAEYFGDVLFTHFGLSGPVVFDASKKIGDLLTHGEVILGLDLEATLNFEEFDRKLQVDFKINNNKKINNCLLKFFPKKIVETILMLSEIKPNRKINSITRLERQKLIKLLKNLRLTVDGLLSYDQAMVTSGGVSLQEIDSKTMQSKIVDNLFFAGEIIDLDGPTGGYNLQICWSSGYVAGICAAKQTKILKNFSVIK